MKTKNFSSGKHHSFLSFPLFLLVFPVLFWTGCSSGPSYYELGMDSLKKQDHENALRRFESYQKEEGSDEEVLWALSDTKFQMAKTALEKIQSLPAEDLTNMIAEGQKAKTLIEASLEHLNGMKIEEDEKEKEKKNNIAEKNQLKGEVIKTLESKEEAKSQLLKEVLSLKEAGTANPEKSYLGLKKLDAYAPYVTEVGETQAAVGSQLISELEKQGLGLLERKKWAEASAVSDKMVSYFPQDQKTKEFQLSVAARKALQDKEFRTAYASLVELGTLNNQHPLYLSHFSKVREMTIKDEVEKIKRLSSRKNVRDVMTSLDHFRYLLSKMDMDETQKMEFTQKFQEQKVSMAALLLQTAKKLSKNKETPYGLIYQLLRYSYLLDPETAKKEQKLAEEGLQALDEKRDLKVLVFLKSDLPAGDPSTSGDPQELENLLKDHFFNKKKAEYLEKKFVFVPVQEAVPEVPWSDIKGIGDFHKKTAGNKKARNFDVLLWAVITENSAQESGINQPFYKSSRYISGTRSVDNPQWYTAQSNLQSAEANYNNNYALHQQMLSNCDSMGDPFSAGICRGAVSVVNSSERDQARSIASTTPRYLQENIISDYQYRHYQVAVNISEKMNYQLVDLINKVLTPAQNIESQVTKVGEIWEGVQPSDVNGLRDKRENVPELAQEKQNAHQTLLTNFENDFLVKLEEKRSLRYCHQAKKLMDDKKARGNPATLDLLQLCLLFSPATPEKDYPVDLLQFAKTEVDKYLQISEEEISALAVDSSADPSGEIFLKKFK